MVIKDREAAFTFTRAVSQLSLCYKFGAEPYAPFPDIPVVTRAQAIPGPVLDLAVAVVRMRLFGKFETVRVGAAGRESFNVTLRSDLAAALRVSLSR